VQCIERGIQPGPLATFPKWKELGRHVKKGEKAITLCLPVTVRRTIQADDGHERAEMMTDVVSEVASTRFVFKPRFVLERTAACSSAHPRYGFYTPGAATPECRATTSSMIGPITSARLYCANGPKFLQLNRVAERRAWVLRVQSLSLLLSLPTEYGPARQGTQDAPNC
jgi:antirestriction factor ArdC-like protein